MQAKIDTLRVKDENGDEYLLYPRTLMQSVIDGDGNTLDSKLTDLERRVDSAGSGGSGEGGTGADGKSAYEIAVEQGFVGDKDAWLESLKGEQGLEGPQGPDGVGISSIDKIGTEGLVDTYQITFTDNTTFDYDVTNGSSGEGGTITISSEAGNAIEFKEDGIYVANNLAEIAQIRNDLAPITKYQKYVNTELGYGHCKLNGSYTPVVDELVPFVLIRGNIQMVDHKVVMRPGQTFQFNISMAFKNVNTNTWGNIAYRLKDLTNDVEIECAKPSGGNPQYENAYSTFAQYTNNTDSECEIGLIVKAIYANDIMDEIYTSFTVQEIGRAITIDPLNYVNETQGIEDAPVGHIISFMGNNAPDHYLACDGTLYNISDYPYLVQHFIDQFGSVNHFGGDGTITFAVPALVPTESVLYCIKYEPTYFMENTYLGNEEVVLWEGSEIIDCSTNGSLELTDNSISLTDSILNYDKLEINYAWYRTSDSTTQIFSSAIINTKDIPIDTNVAVTGVNLAIIYSYVFVTSGKFVDDRTINFDMRYVENKSNTSGDAIKVYRVVGYRTSLINTEEV